MEFLSAIAAELAITVSDPDVWLAIGLALLLGSLCLAFGISLARVVGLLRSDAPTGETLGVGLASGLMVLAAWWAAIASGGRSSFTPVAIGFAVALALAAASRARRPPIIGEGRPAESETGHIATMPTRWSLLKPVVFTAVAGAVFVVAIALLYGSTMAPSPRDGLQPMEYPDEAFYAVLGRDLATSGTETNLSPSGFAELAGLPPQTWYHWGEMWLASAVITVFGTTPLGARYFIVLPVLLLAAGCLTGTIVRRITGASSGAAFLLGFLTCLFLVPVPLIPGGPFFSSWAFGLILGITLYGLGAVAVLFALYSLVVLETQRTSWGLAGFVGSATAFILPAHVVLAVLALFGVWTIGTVRILDSLTATRRLPSVAPIWRRTFFAIGIATCATLAWGLFTGHGLGGGGSLPSVSPFNGSWRDSVAITLLGAGVFLAIPVAWHLVRKESPLEADVYLGTMALVVFGAIAWGARLGDFNMFYVFFGGIAVFATPLAAVAAWRLLVRLWGTNHPRWAFGVAVLCVLQLEYGVAVAGLPKLWASGPLPSTRPIPVAILDAIRHLPPDAKLAYACRVAGEATFAEPQLVSIDAHTGRRVVPMCFQADITSYQIGASFSARTPNVSFAWAPQRVLYPDAEAHPSGEAVASFLKLHGIDYIYADAEHPNTLLAGAVPIVKSGNAEILKVP